MLSKYSWGVDGYGRAHICESNNVIILSMLGGYCGQIGVWMLEEQEDDAFN